MSSPSSFDFLTAAAAAAKAGFRSAFTPPVAAPVPVPLPVQVAAPVPVAGATGMTGGAGAGAGVVHAAAIDGTCAAGAGTTVRPKKRTSSTAHVEANDDSSSSSRPSPKKAKVAVADEGSKTKQCKKWENRAAMEMLVRMAGSPGQLAQKALLYKLAEAIKYEYISIYSVEQRKRPNPDTTFYVRGPDDMKFGSVYGRSTTKDTKRCLAGAIEHIVKNFPHHARTGMEDLMTDPDPKMQKHFEVIRMGNRAFDISIAELAQSVYDAASASAAATAATAASQALNDVVAQEAV